MEFYRTDNFFTKSKGLIVFIFWMFTGLPQVFPISYNLSTLYSYKFSGKDYSGKEFEADSPQGWMINIGVSLWGIGYESYETKLKNTSSEIKLKTNFYDVTYGASGEKKVKGGLWKYLGLGFGFGKSELICNYCESYLYKGLSMQYILLFNFPVTKKFSLKTSYNLKTTKIRHKMISATDDYSATIINIGVGF